ncbi:MAG: Rho termination factor N-terminal domain-containing protein [Acidimicrobiales bacterium]
MPGRRDPGPSVKDKAQYEALRREGASKEKSARIANASARSGRASVGRRGGRAGSYEDMSKHDLYERAKRIGIDGRSAMSKSELINSLRNR